MALYLDNNATTMMSKKTLEAMLFWSNRGNASSSYVAAAEAREMMDSLRFLILARAAYRPPPLCQDPLDAPFPPDVGSYRVIFTSGASESNATFLFSAARAYAEQTGRLPIIVTTAIEHKSMTLVLDELETMGMARVHRIAPNDRGHVEPAAFSAVIDGLAEPVAIVAAMHANNETGAIQDIAAIAAIAHRSGAIFFTDAAQTFAKIPIPLSGNGAVDAASVSFHKVGGPPGAGALLIKARLIRGWGMKPLIAGTQNYGFRGGTENLPALGATRYALGPESCRNFPCFPSLQNLKKRAGQSLEKMVHVMSFREYKALTEAATPIDEPYLVVVFISGFGADYLGSTLLLSAVVIAPGDGIDAAPRTCNAAMKQGLDRRRVIVSIGSACNTASDAASHVLTAIGATPAVKAGTLRVSFGQTHRGADVDAFCNHFVGMLGELYGPLFAKKSL